MTDKKIGPYTYLSPLGIGKISEVYLASYTLHPGEYRVMKIIRKSSFPNKSVFSEIKRKIKKLKCLNSRHLAKVYDFLQTEKNIYIIWELFRDKDLRTYLNEKSKRLSEEEALGILKQLLAGLEALHGIKALHGNISPENVLRDYDQITKTSNFKLMDFAIKEIFEVTNCYIGVINYRAPEMLQNLKEYNNTVDVWSLGVLLYEMLVGKKLFDGTYEKGIKVKILQHQRIDFSKIDVTISNQCQILLNGMICNDPQKRIRWPEIWQHEVWKKEGNLESIEEHLNMMNLEQVNLAATVRFYQGQSDKYNEQFGKKYGYTNTKDTIMKTESIYEQHVDDAEEIDDLDLIRNPSVDKIENTVSEIKNDKNKLSQIKERKNKQSEIKPIREEKEDDSKIGSHLTKEESYIKTKNVDESIVKDKKSKIMKKKEENHEIDDDLDGNEENIFVIKYENSSKTEENEEKNELFVENSQSKIRDSKKIKDSKIDPLKNEPASEIKNDENDPKKRKLKSISKEFENQDESKISVKNPDNLKDKPKRRSEDKKPESSDESEESKEGDNKRKQNKMREEKKQESDESDESDKNDKNKNKSTNPKKYQGKQSQIDDQNSPSSDSDEENPSKNIKIKSKNTKNDYQEKESIISNQLKKMSSKQVQQSKISDEEYQSHIDKKIKSQKMINNDYKDKESQISNVSKKPKNDQSKQNQCSESQINNNSNISIKKINFDNYNNEIQYKESQICNDESRIDESEIVSNLKSKQIKKFGEENIKSQSQNFLQSSIYQTPDEDYEMKSKINNYENQSQIKKKFKAQNQDEDNYHSENKSEIKKSELKAKKNQISNISDSHIEQKLQKSNIQAKDQEYERKKAAAPKVNESTSSNLTESNIEINNQESNFGAKIKKTAPKANENTISKPSESNIQINNQESNFGVKKSNIQKAAPKVNENPISNLTESYIENNNQESNFRVKEKKSLKSEYNWAKDQMKNIIESQVDNNPNELRKSKLKEKINENNEESESDDDDDEILKSEGFDKSEDGENEPNKYLENFCIDRKEEIKDREEIEKGALQFSEIKIRKQNEHDDNLKKLESRYLFLRNILNFVGKIVYDVNISTLYLSHLYGYVVCLKKLSEYYGKIIPELRKTNFFYIPNDLFEEFKSSNFFIEYIKLLESDKETINAQITCYVDDMKGIITTTLYKDVYYLLVSEEMNKEEINKETFRKVLEHFITKRDDHMKSMLKFIKKMNEKEAKLHFALFLDCLKWQEVLSFDENKKCGFDLKEYYDRMSNMDIEELSKKIEKDSESILNREGVLKFEFQHLRFQNERKN